MIDADIVEHLESFRTSWLLSAALRALPIFLHRVPGVSLRFTPGFMLPLRGLKPVRALRGAD